MNEQTYVRLTISAAEAAGIGAYRHDLSLNAAFSGWRSTVTFSDVCNEQSALNWFSLGWYRGKRKAPQRSELVQLRLFA